ncbi:MAG: USG-1 protein [Candidatus Erwinia impunctatus]|nr:USG-1 protein [Culicoides impunctatus]
MSEGWNIALVGATGAVGSALLSLMSEREFPVGNLHLLASQRSAGESRRFDGKTLPVVDVAEFDWSQVQLAFFAAGKEAAAQYAEEAAQSGCLVIELSDLFALDPDVPLVVPDVNPQVLSEYRNRNIIAVANSSVAQLLYSVQPLIAQAGLARLQVVTLISASAHGKQAVDSLAGESARLLNGIPVEESYFGQQLAFNLLPLAADERGIVSYEQTLVEQVRKILQDAGLPVTATTLQAPVFYGSTQLVHIESLRPLSPEEAREAFADTPDILLAEEGTVPSPVAVISAEGQLTVGCIHLDYGITEMLQFCSVADNVRFAGALMAVKTAETLVREYLY